MAVVGTVTEDSRSPELLVGTWAVASGVAAGNQSTLIDLRGYDIIEFYFSVYTGYSSGTYTAGAAIETDNDGLVPIDPGRCIRANKAGATNNQSGYILYPPPQLALALTAAGTGISAYTVKFFARPTSALPVGYKRR